MVFKKKVILILDEGNSDQRATSGSDPEDPVMVPAVGGHRRAEGSRRVHAGSGQKPPARARADIYISTQ